MALSILFKILPFVFFSPLAQGSPMAGASSASLGGTGRAGFQAHEAVFLNSASLGFLNKFYGGASYQSGFLLKGIHRETYGVVITDSTPDLILPGAFAYRRHRIRLTNPGDGEQSFTEDEFRLAFAYNFFKKLSFGLTGVHLRSKAEKEEESGQEDQNKKNWSQSNITAGFLFVLNRNLSFSLSAENVLDTDRNTDQDLEIPDFLMRDSLVSLGTQYIYDSILSVRYEIFRPLKDESDLSHRFGLSLTLRSYFRLNLGVSSDEFSNQSLVTAGFAWHGPRLKLAYGFQNEQRQNIGQRHLVDLWFDF